MRPVWLMATLLSLLPLGQLEARTVGQGGEAVRAVRQVRPRFHHLYWVNQVHDGQVEMTAFPGGASRGERYEIFDREGYLGSATITEVAKEDSGCGQLVIPVATARFETAPVRETSGQTVALGSSARSLRQGRVLVSAEVKEAPPPGSLSTMTFALDWTGDNAPEMALYLYDCQAGHDAVAAPYQSATCIDTWSRENGRWLVVESAQFPRCH
jgi:hypothetical protein